VNTPSSWDEKAGLLNGITHSVTKRYAPQVSQAWCLTRDVFVYRDPVECWGCPFLEGRPGLKIEEVGRSSILPKSVADFQAHPTDWYRQPGYPDLEHPKPKYGAVRAAVLAGTRFKIVRVVQMGGVLGNGGGLRAEIVFDVPKLGRVDASNGMKQSYDPPLEFWGRCAVQCPIRRPPLT
jgi:hypothetical protein